MQNKDKSITLRVSEQERKRLQGNADRYGLTLSAYLRMVGLLGILQDEHMQINNHDREDKDTHE